MTFEEALKVVGSDMTLAARIKIGMAIKGIDAPELITRLKIKNRQTVYKWLSGESKTMDPEQLFKLAEILEMDPEWILSKKGEPQPRGRVTLEHKRLIEVYNALPEKDRRVWEKTGNALLEETGKTSTAQPFKVKPPS